MKHGSSSPATAGLAVSFFRSWSLFWSRPNDAIRVRLCFIRGFIPCFFFVLLIMAPGMIWAAQTQKWTTDSFADFAEGEAHGALITSDGFLRLGPQAKKLVALPDEIIWAVVRGPESNGKTPLFIAEGNEGRIYKWEGDKPAEFFKAKELQVSALALDSSGNLYAGTMPDGKVYKIDPKGVSSIFFEPKEKYIWALQFNDENSLFVATGEKARLYKVNRSGKGDLFYESDESHLRSLLFDDKKHLWVGSQGHGLVLRFDNTHLSQGIPFAAYNSSLPEIKTMVASPDGGIFVGAMGGGKSPLPSLTLSLKTSPLAATTALIAVAQKNPLAKEIGTALGGVAKSEEETEKPAAGEIVKIRTDGAIEKWWADSEDIFTLLIPKAGVIWAGTGKSGKIMELTRPREFNVVNQLEAKSITALFPNEKKGWLAATSNGGAIWSLSNAPGRKGTYESKVLDAYASSHWGAFQMVLVSGTGKVNVQTRTGNTDKPDKIWSDWASLDPQGKIQSPMARYLQYKLTIESGGAPEEKTVAVDSVSLFYRPRNRPPQITQIAIHAPNIELHKVPRQEMPPPPIIQGVGLVAPSPHPAGGGAEEMLASMGQGAILQQVKNMGWRSATWEARDPDHDEMSFDVYYRTVGSEEWKLLKKDLKEAYYSWDAAKWPDGDYYLKVIASDLPSNTEEEALTDEHTSDLFTVDNTPPIIQADVSAEAIKKGYIPIAISDTISIVDEAEISVDGGEWRPFLPVSGIYDSKANEFRLPIGNLKPGDHYFVLRASDSANNVISQTVKFRK